MFHALFCYDPASPLLFTGGQFLCWFSLFYVGFLWLRDHARARLAYLVLFSWFFYYKCGGVFVLALLATTLADFLIALRIASTQRERARRGWLALALSSSLGLLLYFKYTNFFVSSIAQLIGAKFEPFDIALPAGISFYTFQSLSYVIDVYRRRLEPTRDPLEYACYLAYFPQIVAGPIVRAEELLLELRHPPRLDAERVGSGLYLVLLGLVKKAVIADYLARLSDPVFAGGVGLSGFELLLGVYGYAFQIYCDFSGYSDMAVGLGRLTGVELPENFRAPYAAASITEFWRRWHVTLSAWLRDYIYVPLGGNRRGRTRTLVNLMATMTLGGLWHGARASFVLWGVLHGLLLCGEKLVGERWPALRASKLGRLLGTITTFQLVVLLWIPFRSGDLGQSVLLLSRIWREFGLSSAGAVLGARSGFLAMLGFGAALSLVPPGLSERWARVFSRAPLWARAAALVVVVQTTLELRSSELQPFIYFQF